MLLDFSLFIYLFIYLLHVLNIYPAIYFLVVVLTVVHF